MSQFKFTIIVNRYKNLLGLQIKVSAMKNDSTKIIKAVKENDVSYYQAKDYKDGWSKGQQRDRNWFVGFNIMKNCFVVRL